jgi:hypothetical protein
MKSQTIAHPPMLPASNLGRFGNPQGVERDRAEATAFSSRAILQSS